MPVVVRNSPGAKPPKSDDSPGRLSTELDRKQVTILAVIGAVIVVGAMAAYMFSSGGQGSWDNSRERGQSAASLLQRPEKPQGARPTGGAAGGAGGAGGAASDQRVGEDIPPGPGQ